MVIIFGSWCQAVPLTCLQWDPYTNSIPLPPPLVGRPGFKATLEGVFATEVVERIVSIGS